MTSPMSPWLPYIVAGVIAVVVAVAGGLLTDTGPWYRALKTPGWKPPDWAFGPVWTTIFILATWSAARAWGATQGSARSAIVAAFLFNAVLNILWSALFFALRRPDWALFEVAALWLSIAVLIGLIWPHDRFAALLLVPYIVWVSIASALNFAVVQLNR
jgi:translocator protein